MEPLTDAIDKTGTQLTIYYQENKEYRLIIDGPVELQKEISDLVGPAEMWS